jgi:hypothetical protein
MTTHNIPSPETRTELFEGATEGPYEIDPSFGSGFSSSPRAFRITSPTGTVISMDEITKGYGSCAELYEPSDTDARLLAASWTLLRERDTLLSRLEGRAELPEGYDIPVIGLRRGGLIQIWLRDPDGSAISVEVDNTPANRRILTGMAWAHWHTSEVGK